VKQRIGYLPEESYLYRYLTAEEILHFYGGLFNIPGAERTRRVESLLDLVGLTGARRRPLREFSKGMARRVGLAQALINDPELLILDEPTSGLDPIGTREIKDLLLVLKKRGKTVFLSSHLLADVEDVCDRIAILYGGKLCTEGRVADLLARRDATQIRTGLLPPETVERVRQVIREGGRAGDIAVETPRESLESLFLRVVRQARESRAATSGAVAGAVRDAFLAGPAAPAADVVADLMRPAETPAPAAAAAAEAPRPARGPERKDLLRDLVAGTSAEPPSPAPPPEAPRPAPAKPAAPVDASVIDRLTRDGDKT
jgi:ABC-2 type transport system ATP-binding protein